jgi:hypothetical protein
LLVQVPDHFRLNGPPRQYPQDREVSHSRHASWDDSAHQSPHGWGQWPQPHIHRHIRKTRDYPGPTLEQPASVLQNGPGQAIRPSRSGYSVISFRDASNYRTETVTFRVVKFSEPYHIILGQPCYMKFMVIPNYAYLKLKISGPTGVNTVESKTQRALDYE